MTCRFCEADIQSLERGHSASRESSLIDVCALIYQTVCLITSTASSYENGHVFSMLQVNGSTEASHWGVAMC